MESTYLKNILFGFTLIFICSCGDDDSPSLSSEKIIVNFSISNTEATIIESTRIISLIISETDLTSLSPTIIISANATVSPSSGITQNFSSPITYTVTAEDGSSIDYIVTITSSVSSFAYGGKNYAVIKENKTWQDAVSFAVDRGGYLVEINGFGEQNAIYSELEQIPSIFIGNTRNRFGFGSVWIGGHDLSAEGVWIWDGNNDGNGDQFWNGGLNGNAVGGLYNNWGNVEPDNFEDQNVLSMSLEDVEGFVDAGEWNDLDKNENSLFFVIEYD